MATRSLLHLSTRRRPLRSIPSTRSITTTLTETLTAPAETTTAPPLQPYDQIALAVRSKLKRLDSPDARFLRFASPHPQTHPFDLAAPQTHLTTLPTGLRLASAPDLAARTATVAAFVDAGSRFDPDGLDGVAHLAERVVRRSPASQSGKQLEREIARIGGSVEAYTSKEQTAFFVRVLKEDVSRAVEILADVLQKPFIEEGVVEREKAAILKEIGEASEQSKEVLFDHLHATAFQHTPLGRTIHGSAASIKKITEEHLQNYISTHYTAPRVVISASGAVKHEDLVEQAKKLFTNLSDDPTTAAQLVAKGPAAFTGSEVRIFDDDLPLAQFAVGFSGASWTDPDSIALMVIQNMLGSWDKSSDVGKHAGSELVQKAAINDIAESISAFNTTYKDIGLFGVHAVAKPDALDDLAWAIMHEFSKLSYRVSEADVIRARNKLKSSLLLHLDGTSPTAEDIGRQLLTYGRRIPIQELFARIDTIDAIAVKRVANRFIFDQDVTIAAIGPIQKLPDYNWFRRRTFLLRY